MRLSFLVLVGVIAVCNTEASAKAVAPATEDEANGVGRSWTEQDPQKDTAYEAAVEKSNALGGENTFSKRHASPSNGKRRSVVKKSDKVRKAESKKFGSKRFEGFRSKSAANKLMSRAEKREIQDKKRRGSGPINNPQRVQHAANILPGEYSQVEELAESFHNSLRKGLDNLFRALSEELRRQREEMDEEPVYDDDLEYLLGDMGDEYTADDMRSSYCPDDNTTALKKRNDESPLEYLKEAIPALVERAQTILSEALEKTWSPGTDGMARDYDVGPSASGTDDLAEETTPFDDIGDKVILGDSDAHTYCDYEDELESASGDTRHFPVKKNNGDGNFPQP